MRAASATGGRVAVPNKFPAAAEAPYPRATQGPANPRSTVFLVAQRRDTGKTLSVSARPM